MIPAPAAAARNTRTAMAPDEGPVSMMDGRVSMLDGRVSMLDGRVFLADVCRVDVPGTRRG